jgi:outer membrane receptor protein involved in Fe transport
MRRFSLLGTSALGSAAVIGLSMVAAAPAHAQSTPSTSQTQPSAGPGGAQPDTPACPDSSQGTTGTPNNPEGCLQGEVELESGQDADTATAGGDDQSIVVTGSRIRRPNLTSTVPITSVTIAELPNQGQASIGDALNDLPALRSTFSQQNSGRFIGTAGLNLLDLRGLGTARTLVLVNNRRHVTSTPGDFDVDVNTIPQDLIERVDVVTGGSSAVYGSDALAGVVNFILRRNFDGIRLRAQGGISSRGDRGISFAALTAGRNFADDRGNVAVSLEYTNAEPLFFRDRPNQSGFNGLSRCDFIAVENTVTNPEPPQGNGIPDNQLVCNIRSGTLSEGGTIGVGLPNGERLRFAPNGDIFSDIPLRTFPNTTNVQGGQGSTVRETGQFAVGQDRYTANLLARFSVSEAFTPFIEAKYVRQEVQQQGQPSFFQGNLAPFFAGNFGVAVPNIRCDNPFLTPQALETIRARFPVVRNAAGQVTSLGLCNTSTGAFNPAGALPVSRFNTDTRPREEDDIRQTYRVVAGIEGDFNGDWHYEISGNYGRFENETVRRNELFFRNVDGTPAGFALAVDAVRNAQGQIVCRVNADTDPNNDVPGCVPINLFGSGNISPAGEDFILTTSTVNSRATQKNALALINGDLSQLFELPGGPVGFAVGAEYRRETAFEDADPLSKSGGTFFNQFQLFDPPALEVKEVFGEISIPLLRDLPFARELTFSGAARYSDYNTAADKTFSYNVNGIYAPNRDIRFRANYSRAVRVPTLGDLFSPATQSFAFLADPCDAQFITNGPNRVANCNATGVPTTIQPGSPCISAATPVGSPFINCVARSNNIPFQQSGNELLQEETSKSLTLGVVLTPQFLSGFSLTVDYYDIRVRDLIATLGPQTILNLCFDQPNINNQFCQLLTERDQFGLFQSPAAISGGVNFAKQTTKGIDVDLAYRRTFGALRFSTRGIATYVLNRSNFTNPQFPFVENRIRSELGDPVFNASLSTTLGYGIFDLSHTMRYIGRQTIAAAFETQNRFNGNQATNADAFPRVYYPDVFYHDFRLQMKVNPEYRFYLGIDNAFDRDPPLDLTGTGAGSGIFSNIGRYFYAGAEINF